MSNSRSQELNRQFAEANAELIVFIEACSPEDWRTIVPDEQRTVGVLLHHIAYCYERLLALVQLKVEGQAPLGKALPPNTHELAVKMNADHAQAQANCSPTEVIDFTRTEGSIVSTYISGLSDEQLDWTGHKRVVKGEMSVQRVIEGMIEHGKDHVQSIQATLSAQMATDSTTLHSPDGRFIN